MGGASLPKRFLPKLLSTALVAALLLTLLPLSVLADATNPNNNWILDTDDVSKFTAMTITSNANFIETVDGTYYLIESTATSNAELYISDFGDLVSITIGGNEVFVNTLSSVNTRLAAGTVQGHTGLAQIKLASGVITLNIQNAQHWASQIAPVTIFFKFVVGTSEGTVTMVQFGHGTVSVIDLNVDGKWQLTATSDAGYVFGYWEYATTVENPQESDWQRDNEHTASTAIIEVNEDIWYRAHFRPTAFIPYEGEAYFGDFTGSFFDRDPPSWYYEDYACVATSWGLSGLPWGGPAYVGTPATLVLPIATIDGTLSGTPVLYKLYFGDDSDVALIGETSVGAGWTGALLNLNFYVRAMPDVSSVTLNVIVQNVEGTEVPIERTFDVAPKQREIAEPISVSFRLVGSTLSTGNIDFWTDDVDYKGAEYQTWIATTEYVLNEGDSVYDLFVLALDDAGLTSVGAAGNYVSAIYAPDCFGGYRLAEFTNGMRSGWMYTVNDVHVGYGLKEQALHDGDVVIWHYVCDYLYEVPDWFEGGTVGDASMWNKWLEAPDVDPSIPVLSDDATLSDLTVDGVSVAEFDSLVLSYSVVVPYETVCVVVSGVAADAGAEVAVAGPDLLDVGENMFTVTVTAEDGTTTKEYTVVVVREAAPVSVISATPSAFVTQLNGNTNDLTIAVTETLSDGTTNIIVETFRINNNAADTYTVGSYNVYVDTKGNTQIRDCYIISAQ